MICACGHLPVCHETNYGMGRCWIPACGCAGFVVTVLRLAPPLVPPLAPPPDPSEAG